MANIADKSFTTKSCRILFCPTCRPHEYQDKKRGDKMRVHNPAKEGKFRCSVCGNLREG
jgi:hypothetical protein